MFSRQPPCSCSPSASPAAVLASCRACSQAVVLPSHELRRRLTHRRPPCLLLAQRVAGRRASCSPSASPAVMLLLDQLAAGHPAPARPACCRPSCSCSTKHVTGRRAPVRPAAVLLLDRRVAGRRACLSPNTSPTAVLPARQVRRRPSCSCLTSSSPAILLLLDQRVAGHRAPARPSTSPAVALLFDQCVAGRRAPARSPVSVHVKL
jgi:hypothetical protein